MHAYLVVGSAQDEVGRLVDKKVKLLNHMRLDFSLTKIEDARDLSNLIKLKNEVTIVIKNIDDATTPALNAFLKNLEEPGENINYILTASNLSRVLPTIVSRSQIIYALTNPSRIENEKVIIEFLKADTSEKVKYIWSISDRAAALDFINNLILYTHYNLDRSRDPSYAATILEAADEARRAIESYGVYKLHLLRFTIEIQRYSKTKVNEN